jgi:hypothetical protein
MFCMYVQTAAWQESLVTIAVVSQVNSFKEVALALSHPAVNTSADQRRAVTAALQ